MIEPTFIAKALRASLAAIAVLMCLCLSGVAEANGRAGPAVQSYAAPVWHQQTAARTIRHSRTRLAWAPRQYAPDWRHGAPAIAVQAAWGGGSRVVSFMRHLFARSGQCVDLVRRVAGIPQGVTEWRRGTNAIAMRLPIGTPVATFLSRAGRPSDRYDGGVGVGAPGHNTTHAAIVAGYDERGNLKLLEQYRGRGPHLAIYRVGDARGGENDARNYFSINGANGRPLGANNPLAGRVAWWHR